MIPYATAKIFGKLAIEVSEKTLNESWTDNIVWGATSLLFDMRYSNYHKFMSEGAALEIAWFKKAETRNIQSFPSGYLSILETWVVMNSIVFW